MQETVLHLGAHRTGTTSLQRFLQRHDVALQEHGIQQICPPVSRERPLQTLVVHGDRALISEENILGTMETCLEHAQLYPNLKPRLARYSTLLDQVDVVFLSIRDLADWWTSVIAFCVGRASSLPCEQTLEKLSASPRGWYDVVSEVRDMLPNARMVVREFEWKKDNPKQQLRRLTKWSIWDETSGLKKSHNKRPTVNAIAMSMLNRSEFDSLSRLPIEDDFQPLNDKQIKNLTLRYTEDLNKFRVSKDVELWENHDFLNDRRSPPSTPKKVIKKTTIGPTCFLHIGKTGGTFLKSIAVSADHLEPRLYLGKHSDTLTSTIRDFGRRRKLGFFFRNPTERFISGFQSRLRRGQPTYNVDWTLGEATAFSFFPTPNDLAEAISTDDERLKSAAYFAFRHIFHLKHGYVHYLNSPEAVLYEHSMKNIIFCCETHNIDAHLQRVLRRLDLPLDSPIHTEKNAAPGSRKAELSELAETNLRDFWAAEFDIYETCKTVAKELGFSD